jgi:hypothetical protein
LNHDDFVFNTAVYQPPLETSIMAIFAAATILLGLNVAPPPAAAEISPKSASEPAQERVCLAAGDALGMAMHDRHAEAPLVIHSWQAKGVAAATPNWTAPSAVSSQPILASTDWWWFVLTSPDAVVAIGN